jgi:3-deoxy-D-manno-octulosonic acid (KDO) 8-phosphate synthase
MAVRMTVSMPGEVGRRHGGRSKFRAPIDYADSATAVADLRTTFHPGHAQSDSDYLEALALVGIDVYFEEI